MVIKYNTVDIVPFAIYEEFCNLGGLILHHVTAHSIDFLLLLFLCMHNEQTFL